MRSAISVPWLCLAILAPATLVAPQPAAASDQVPFRAAFNTEFEVIGFAFPILTVEIRGEGQALHMGRSTTNTVSPQVVNVLTGIGTATASITAANGDAIVFTLVFGSTPGPSVVTFEGTFHVIGGTGRFAGATGGGSLSGQATNPAPVPGSKGEGFVSLDGTISSPGSLK